HSESLYFSSGDICLSAPYAQALESSSAYGLIFRVHRFTLSLHSPVFRDMFDLPEQPGANVMYDGVTLVQMPDSAEDIEALLYAFYHGYELPFPRLHPGTPNAVKGILKMANKYQVDKIRRIIIERLESDWPQSLADWRRLEAEIEVMGSDGWAHVEDPDTMVHLHLDRRLPEPASAIRLAQEYNIPSILPAAYYQLSRLTVEYDTESVEQDAEAFVMTHGIVQRTAQWSLLEGRDFMRVLRGQ
ncbi:uncharacterized protein STEHIDRAFT_23738, partial [Stereum hirsutum FP-91666 SS1]|uniref:uncharacterized protein n=1 Tax=Stereum hirsutum (strain FP-91666) TaxID=721885 RepID=UPI0004449B16